MQQPGTKTATAGDAIQRTLLLLGKLRRGLCFQRFGGTTRFARLRRVNAPQPGRQGREHHFAQWRMVVGRTEFTKTEPVGGECRQIVKAGFERFQLRRSDFAFRRQGDEDANARFFSEGNAYPPSNIGDRQRDALGDEIVEEAVQRQVKGDAG